MPRRWRVQVGTLVALVAMLVTPSLAAARQEHVTGETWAGQAAVSSYPRLVDTARGSPLPGTGTPPVASSPDAGAPPANITLPSGLRDLLRRMWQRSPTFRRQCARIAGVPDLRVRVTIAGPGAVGLACAKTRLRRGGTGLEADILLGCMARVVELVAHELEHIIEQLDGVRLAEAAARAPSLVAVSGDGTFETRRAIDAGRAVAGEVAGAGK